MRGAGGGGGGDARGISGGLEVYERRSPHRLTTGGGIERQRGLNL